MSLFVNSERSPLMQKIMRERKKAASKSVDIGNGTTAFEYKGLIEIHNYMKIIRERCPSCRRETVIDLIKKMMTCDNEKCKYFNKFIVSTINARKKRR